jgi:hypothetical protein
MRTGTAIFLVAVGAALLFALRSGSPHWVNLRIVGVILIVAGVLGVLLPRVTRTPRDLLRRWVIPADRPSTGQPPTGERPEPGASPNLVREPGPEDPTLADQILDLDHHLPV